MDNNEKLNIPGYNNLELKNYLLGYILSLFLTFSAYFLIVNSRFSSLVDNILIIVLAILQFMIQILFFLHLGQERKPKWKLMVLVMMVLVVLILVLGSLWIMNNLNYRMMSSPQAINNYLKSQGGGL